MGPVSFSSHEHDAISELMTLCIEVRASREVRKTQRKVRRGRLGRFGGMVRRRCQGGGELDEDERERERERERANESSLPTDMKT
jgi:hypothetical protein